MLIALCCWIVAVSWTPPSSLAPAILATAPATRDARDPDWTPETVDDRWAEKVLADPGYDRGWMQSCQDDWSDGRHSECVVREFPYDPKGHPTAIHGGANGGMTVIGWDRAQTRVLYRVKARAETAEQAKALADKIHLVTTQGWIRPQGPETRVGEWWSVEIKAWVPRASDLSLETRNGPIGVRRVRGTMDIHSVNGPIALLDLSGAVMARAQNGPLHVALDGTKWIGAGLDAAAQNGPVDLEVPKDYSARLETGTYNGPSSIDYPLGLEGRVRGHFTTTLGAGGAPVRVVTDNGPFHVGERSERVAHD